MKYKLPVAIVLWAILIVSIVINFLGSTSQESFWISFLATLSGIVIGIPVALGINDYQNKILARKSEQEQQEQQTKMLKKVLSVINAELTLNQKILSKVFENQKESPQYVLYFGLSNETWKAISDSGDLKWIDDPYLLHKLSFAYVYIRRVSFFEDKFFDPGFNMGVAITSSSGNTRTSFAGERAQKGALALRERAIGAISDALKEIENKLEIDTSNQSKSTHSIIVSGDSE